MRQGNRPPGIGRDLGGAAPDGQQATRKRGRRGGARRGKHAGTVRRINAKARERQAAWLETGQPNVTERLTRELNGREGFNEGLYAEHRVEQAGTLTDPYFKGDPSRSVAR